MDQIRREDPNASSLWWSCIFHGGLIALIVAKEVIAPSTPKFIPPTLRVDLVGLPDLVKGKLAQLPKLAPPPLEVPKEESKIKEQARPEDPEDMVLNPTEKIKEAKKSEKAEKAAEKEREKKISNALARIRSLEKMKEEDGAEEKPIVIKGNAISKGTSLSGEAKESLEATYYDQVREVLSSNWAIPAWLSRAKYSAQVQILVGSDGMVTRIRFTKPSGNDQFDAEVRNTIKQSQPLPKPSKDVADAVSSRGILVGFPL